jgi:metal-responsive CopG/Arc/MetJ family transcriptional regulator
MFFGTTFHSEIEKPIIKAEVEVKNMKRIDILVYEKGKYALVFENKIWDAVEQENQLQNYIDGMKEPEYGFTDEQIYIVYLPSVEGHGPTQVSWSEGVKKSFEKRYRSISFREGIIKWLESTEIQQIDEEYFVHSRFLFLDFLKRKFNLTETSNMENKKIDDYLRKELGLTDDNANNIALLEGKMKEISECANHLERMRRDYCCQVIGEIENYLKKDYPDRTICKDQKFAQSLYTGIAIPYKDRQDAIYVLVGFEGQNFIYGATYAPNYKTMRSEMQESTEISRFYANGIYRKGSDWLFYKNTTIDEGYKCLKDLISEMLKAW